MHFFELWLYDVIPNSQRGLSFKLGKDILKGLGHLLTIKRYKLKLAKRKDNKEQSKTETKQNTLMNCFSSWKNLFNTINKMITNISMQAGSTQFTNEIKFANNMSAVIHKVTTTTK